MFRFEPRPDLSAPATVTYRRLLARTRSASEADRKAYFNALLSDPSCWGLYEMTVATEGHVSEQIPAEILQSPNLRMSPPLASVVADIVEAYEVANGPEAAAALLAAQAPQIRALLKDGPEPIATASWQGKVGVALEKLWIQPGGLVVMRLRFRGRTAAGRPPKLKSPEANPWGLKPDQIQQAVQSNVRLDGTKAEIVGVAGFTRGAKGYLLYRFESKQDLAPPERMTYKHLLVREQLPSETSLQDYANAVLKDPSAWGLYEMSISSQSHVSVQIPQEALDAPHLRTQPPLAALIKEVFLRYEEATGKEGALGFYRAQAPRVRQMLKSEVDRLRAEGG